MKGFYLEILRDFVDSKIGRNIWETSTIEVHIPIVKTFEDYPDELWQGLLDALVKNSNSNKERFLFDFGRHFIKSPSVQKICSDAFRKITSREFLLDIKKIHQDVATTIPGSNPPSLKMEKPAFDELKIYYSSKRRLCPFLKGIIQGTAECFREKILLTENTCMENEETQCEINIKFLSM